MTAPNVTLATVVGSDGPRQLILGQLSAEDQQSLAIALTPLPSAPPARKAQIEKWKWPHVDLVVAHAHAGLFGHAIAHHCLPTLPTGINCYGVLSALASFGKPQKAVKKVLTAVEVRMGNRDRKPKGIPIPAFPSAGELTLCARTLGVDIVSLTVGADSAACDAGAFNDRAELDTAMRWLAHLLWKHIHVKGGRRQSATYTRAYGEVRIVWDGHKGGYEVNAPIRGISDATGLACTGYVIPHTFAQVCGTVAALVQGKTKALLKGPTDWADLFRALAHEFATRVTDFTRGTVRGIFVEPTQPLQPPYHELPFWTLSVYPIPKSPHDKS